MTDQAEPTQGPGTSGPGPDGAGFTYRGAEEELIVVARPEARLRARAEGVRSVAGADVSALDMFLSDEQLALEPLFGSEERLPQAAPRRRVPRRCPTSRCSTGSRRGSRAEELRARSPLAGDRHGLREAGRGAGVRPDREGRRRRGRAPPVTPDFSGRQVYLDSAPAASARVRLDAAGRHAGRRADHRHRGRWRFDHEDLLANQGGVVGGTPSATSAGATTAPRSIGEIGGDGNAFGVTGICPDAVDRADLDLRRQGLGRGRSARPPTAARRRHHPDRAAPARAALRRRERTTRTATSPSSGGRTTSPRSATPPRRGVIVVEAAGNGARDLDDADLRRAARRASRPSVDATRSTAPTATPARSSSARARRRPAPTAATTARTARGWGSPTTALVVDAQGWGREVTTTGYGDLQGGPDEDVWYTDQFSGTSSASPIVVGALGCVQGMLAGRAARRR